MIPARMDAAGAARGAAARAYLAVGRTLPDVANGSAHNQPPAAFKVYRGARRLALGDLTGLADPISPVVATMLWETHRLSRQQWFVSDPRRGGAVERSVLRPVPSAGALFCCDLYVSWTGADTAGIYHHDVVHDALALVRAGAGGDDIADATRDVPRHAVFLVTVSFQRNVRKYGAFGYRLQGLDAGAVVAQLSLVGHALGALVEVLYAFDDAALGRLLSLDPLEESVYAVVTATLPTAPPPSRRPGVAPRSAAATAVTEPAAGLRSLPQVLGLHRAAAASTFDVRSAQVAAIAHLGPRPPEWIPLPQTPIDLRAAAPRRRSPHWVFGDATVSLEILAGLLGAVAAAPAHDAPAPRGDAGAHVAVFCLVRRVGALAAGCYRYDVAQHRLGLLWEGDHVAVLGAAMPPHQIGYLRCTNLTVILAGSLGSALETAGDRWYRIQAMHAGGAAHRLCLAAVAQGLAAQINCAYEPDAIDDLLGIGGSELQSLAQITVGGERPSGLVLDQPITDISPAPHRGGGLRQHASTQPERHR